MLKVGITGGIGSGKTLVCKLFETLGIPVYYADDRAKYLMTHNAELVAAIKASFGEEAYVNGELNRAYLSEKVFNNPEALAQLNALVHPAVRKDTEQWQLQQADKPYTLREAALLFESGSYKALDKIIVVTAPKSLRIARVMKRDGFTAEQVEARMKNQLPEEEKVAKADFIINNDEQHPLIEQVMALHQKLLMQVK